MERYGSSTSNDRLTHLRMNLESFLNMMGNLHIIKERFMMELTWKFLRTRLYVTKIILVYGPWTLNVVNVLVGLDWQRSTTCLVKHVNIFNVCGFGHGEKMIRIRTERRHTP